MSPPHGLVDDLDDLDGPGPEPAEAVAPPPAALGIDAALAGIAEHRRPQARMVYARCLPRYRRLYLAALAGELSPRRALRVHCLHCCGWESTSARECTAYGCPLWAYNPWGVHARALRAARKHSQKSNEGAEVANHG
jgi:hypothetical protein